MNELELLVDLNLQQDRQGPGGTKETLQALELLNVDTNQNIRIADIGCGSGAQTIDLAQNTKAHITAVDIFPQFLDKLKIKAENLNLSDRITTLCASMDDMPFEKESLDVIWSEGAIYIMGFEKGIQYWSNFLKKDGYIAISELSWTTHKRPVELEKFWKEAYPEIDTISNKVKVLEGSGYSPVGFFTLPAYCWLDNYYQPLQKEMAAFLGRHPNNKLAEQVVNENRDEIELYQKYKEYYSYGFYIARKI